MRRVTKAEFKEIYFRLGGGDATGWGAAYWDKFFEKDERFVTEESEDSMFDMPGDDESR